MEMRSANLQPVRLQPQYARIKKLTVTPLEKRVGTIDMKANSTIKATLKSTTSSEIQKNVSAEDLLRPDAQVEQNTVTANSQKIVEQVHVEQDKIQNNNKDSPATTLVTQQGRSYSYSPSVQTGTTESPQKTQATPQEKLANLKTILTELQTGKKKLVLDKNGALTTTSRRTSSLVGIFSQNILNMGVGKSEESVKAVATLLKNLDTLASDSLTTKEKQELQQLSKEFTKAGSWTESVVSNNKDDKELQSAHVQAKSLSDPSLALKALTNSMNAIKTDFQRDLSKSENNTKLLKEFKDNLNKYSDFVQKEITNRPEFRHEILKSFSGCNAWISFEKQLGENLDTIAPLLEQTQEISDSFSDLGLTWQKNQHLLSNPTLLSNLIQSDRKEASGPEVWELVTHLKTGEALINDSEALKAHFENIPNHLEANNLTVEDKTIINNTIKSFFENTPLTAEKLRNLNNSILDKLSVNELRIKYNQGTFLS